MDILRSLVGMGLLLVIAYALSVNRRAIRMRTLLAAMLLQVAVGALVLFLPQGSAALSSAARGVNDVLEMGNHGVSFMFGGLVDDKMFQLFGGHGFIFALRVLPMIIFVTALIAVLYHIGIMKWVINVVGAILGNLLGVSRIEACSAVATTFIGQSEIPAFVKPFISRMTGAELFAVMSSGMASIAGSVLVGYIGLGVKLEYLLAASFMAVPGGLLFAKIIFPTTETSTADFTHLTAGEHRSANVIDAAASGAMTGLRIAVSVGAMLIAFIGLIALLNAMIGNVAGLFGYSNLTMQGILGHIFSPLAWLIGVPWQNAQIAGNFIGEKMILNEFVAYADLSPYLKSANDVLAAGLTVLDPRTIAIVSFALCGFSNFSSIAILAGGFSAVAPERRAEVTRYGLRVVAASTLSNLMSAAIAGIFLSLH